MLLDGLADYYDVTRPGGAFYLFPRLPWGTGLEFVTRAIERYQMLLIPGSVFSRRDTHFRISYAADDAVLSAASRRCGNWPKRGEEAGCHC